MCVSHTWNVSFILLESNLRFPWSKHLLGIIQRIQLFKNLFYYRSYHMAYVYCCIYAKISLEAMQQHYEVTLRRYVIFPKLFNWHGARNWSSGSCPDARRPAQSAPQPEFVQVKLFRLGTGWTPKTGTNPLPSRSWPWMDELATKEKLVPSQPPAGLDPAPSRSPAGLDPALSRLMSVPNWSQIYKRILW